MDLMRPVRAFDGYQQKHKWLAIPFAVLRKFGNDQAGSLAALVAYYAFFSLFPLLLVMTTILGFVLQHNTGAQTAVEHSVLSQLPVIGQQIRVRGLHGSVPTLVIGLFVALLGCVGVTSAAQNAFDRVWAVPFKHRPDFLRSRLRGLGLIMALGLLFVAATGVSGLITGLHGPLAKIAGVLVSYVVNFALFLAAFRFLTSATVGTSRLWIGVAFAALFWEVLQFFGGVYVNHVLRKSTSSVGGEFATVLALLVFLHLGAQLTLYAAEINTVLMRRLWPRSLMGPPESRADEATLRALAKVEERYDTEQVDVHFEHEAER
jgi:membrane protein